MAGSLRQKKIMNMVYGLGAAIVLIGALFKILHFSIGPLTGGLMLTIGLLTEAIIFIFSAFEAVEEDLDWSLVYPELAGGQSLGAKGGASNGEGLSDKLDAMLEEAQLDSSKMSRLATSIESFAGAAENIAPAANSVAATSAYSEQLSLAATQMESLATNLSSLNGVYGGMLSAMSSK